MEHPTTCFGLSRHNVIIPLIVSNVEDLGDGCFEYSIDLNHPKPSKYLKFHHKNFFAEKIVSKHQPLCDKYTKVRVSLSEIKSLAKKEILEERAEHERVIKCLDKQLDEIDQAAKDYE
ncbi:hypothetical protein VCHA53O466_140005 [Vibrio chagasii]|nr:hypothetical protein VCHA53O466_140005 [Vibrio chagasii]